MKADLSRLSFDPLAGFARVLQQQGRPLLDADWNEQAAILLHRLHRLGHDVIGPFGGPSDGECGFEVNGIAGSPHDFKIGAGRYYVNGICCENPKETCFTTQPRPVHKPAIVTGKVYLVFLDVWEEVVALADEPSMREPALGGLDTALRTRITWQVRVQEIPANCNNDYVIDPRHWPGFVELWQHAGRGRLRARIADEIGTDPHYRGQENQLYRVEVHYGGSAGEGREGATFKWSRENGAVMLRLREVNGHVLTLDRLDASGAASLVPGDWLEAITEGTDHDGTPRHALIHVQGRGPGRDQVTIDPATVTVPLDPARPGGLWFRRWDQRKLPSNRGGAVLRDGTIVIAEGIGDAGWIALESGIQVQFEPDARYRPGDYWLIPARVADGGTLLWPQADGQPMSSAPHGIHHNYAPLAIVEFMPVCKFRETCRRQFKPLESSWA